MIRTAMAFTRAKPRAGLGPNASHARNVANAAPRTAGTNQPVTRSTRAWIGSLVPCAAWTIVTICASTVCAPIVSTRRSRLPLVFSVPPTVRSPSSFATGTGSPVIMLSSTKLLPATTTPSAATRSPGRTRTISPSRKSARGMSPSRPSRTIRAVEGARAIRRAIAAPVRPFARASRARPRRIRVTMRTEASKYRCAVPGGRNLGSEDRNQGVDIGRSRPESDEGVHIGMTVQ